MRRSRSLCLSLGVLLLGACSQGRRHARASHPVLPQIQQVGEGSLGGVVVNYLGEPLVGARIELQQTNPGGQLVTQTNGRGQYLFRGLPGGSYAVTVVANNSRKAVVLPENAKFRANIRIGPTGRRIVEPNQLPDDAIVRLVKSGCLGPCSSFTMTVFQDGRWTWEDASDVRVTDPRSGQLSSRQLARVRKVERSLAATPDYDWGRIFDVSMIYLTVRDGDNVVEFVTRKNTQTPPSIAAAVRDLGRILPIRRFVGRSWR